MSLLVDVDANNGPGRTRSDDKQGRTMVTKTFKSTALAAYKKKLDTPLKYGGDYQAFENIGEVRAQNSYPSDKDVVKFLNAKAKAKARAAAMTAALEAIGIVKPTLENDDQMKLREFVKVLLSSKKYTEEDARTLAATTLGIAWEGDEDDEDDDE